MYLIYLKSNDETPSKVALIVTKKQLDVINNLQCLGGFLRYSIDIYDDKVKSGRIDKKALAQFMFNVFGSWQIMNYFFKPITKQNYWFDYLAK